MNLSTDQELGRTVTFFSGNERLTGVVLSKLSESYLVSVKWYSGDWIVLKPDVVFLN